MPGTSGTQRSLDLQLPWAALSGPQPQPPKLAKLGMLPPPPLFSGFFKGMTGGGTIDPTKDC